MSTWKRTDKNEGIALLRLPGTNWSEEFGRNIAGLKKKKIMLVLCKARDIPEQSYFTIGEIMAALKREKRMALLKKTSFMTT